MPLDVAAARAMTPGCDHVLHLNHAGASLLPRPVLDAMTGHLRLEAEMGGYEAAAVAAEDLRRPYTALASLFGGRPEEIALLDSASRAWDMAVHSLALQAGDRVLISRSEYGANAISLLQLSARTGCELQLIEDDEAGQIDLGALERALGEGETALVSLVHVPTQSGLVNPAADVGRLCREAGVLFILDACQSAGQIPLDVHELGCGILTGNGRKFLRGPRGTGYLWMDSALIPNVEPAMLDLHAARWVAPDRYEIRGDAGRFEMWEKDAAAQIGLGVAVEHALSWGIEAIQEVDTARAAGLRARLAEIPGVTVRDRGPRLCAITTFTVDGIEPEDVQDRLRAQRMNVAVSTLDAAPLDLSNRGLEAVVRASVHYTTTEDELDRFADAISSIAGAPAS